MSNFYTGKNVMEAINGISTYNDTPKEIKITPPEGYEIDIENSTFDCIKFKPVIKRWRDKTEEMFAGYYIHIDCSIHKTGRCSNKEHNRNVFATEKQAKSALAMARISQIMANDERFGGVVTDKEWHSLGIKYIIERLDNSISKTTSLYCYSFLAFHTSKQRDLFLEENEDLVKDYLMLDQNETRTIDDWGLYNVQQGHL